MLVNFTVDCQSSGFIRLLSFISLTFMIISLMRGICDLEEYYEGSFVLQMSVRILNFKFLSRNNTLFPLKRLYLSVVL